MLRLKLQIKILELEDKLENVYMNIKYTNREWVLDAENAIKNSRRILTKLG